MESARNVSELKSSFIRAQVRILSEALQPQEDWRLYAPESEEGDLSDKVVDDVLQKCKDSTLDFLTLDRSATDLMCSERCRQATQSRGLLLTGHTSCCPTDCKSLLVLDRAGCSNCAWFGYQS